MMKKLLLTLSAMAIALSAYAVSDKERAAIEERIQPVGSVCMQGDDCGSASAGAAGGAGSPEEIYAANCQACHGNGVAGAPKPGADAWDARLDAGIDTVYANAINGKGGMPAMGLCMSCSEDDIRETVDWMIEGE